MTTFSQLVDKIVSETKRPDLLSEVCSYLNQTVRELHMEPQRNNIIHYKDNLREIRLLSASESTLVWEIPRPQNFQGMAGVRYDSVWRNGEMMWPREMTPGPQLMGKTEYWYRAGSSIVFSGFGGVGAYVSLAWYEYPPSLKYYAPISRPATYDDELGWAYAVGVPNTPEGKAVAQALVSNWLILRWAMVIEEGLRAKVYKRLDDPRAKTSYSMYSSLRQGVYTSEISELSGAH